MQKMVQCLHRTRCRFYVFISALTSRYNQILETRDYFKILYFIFKTLLNI